MTNYCAAIAALFAEGYKVPRATADTDRNERRRIEAMHADIHRQMRNLQQQAAGAFAKPQWLASHRTNLFNQNTYSWWCSCSARRMAGLSRSILSTRSRRIYFRETTKPYRPVAIVGQPYDTSVDKGTELACSLGLELHAPPNFTASWWYPNHARFFCLTRPGVVVRFLPDQFTFEKGSPRNSDAGTDTTMRIGS
jgi:hypothetical protein